MPEDSRASRDNDVVRADDAQRNPDAGLSDLIHRDRAVNRPVAGTLRFDDGAHDDLEIEQGADVLGADGDKIGEVVDIAGDYLVVERGFFIPKDVYIPKDIIAIDQDEAGLRLALTRKQFDAREWSDHPDDEDDDSQ